jgi:hypothetical protein
MALIPFRSDTSTKLVHLLKGRFDADDRRSDETVVRDTLRSILSERKLKGGNSYIKGGYRCVCFSEAPISALAMLLAMPHATDFRYLPFGVMVDKQWLYDRGGGSCRYNSRSRYRALCCHPIPMALRDPRRSGRRRPREMDQAR